MEASALRRRFRAIVSALIPVPFLLIAAMLAAGFWQNEADFVFGRVQAIEAVLVDAGPPHPNRGRPRYFPTFRLAAGEFLTLTQPTVASELPSAGAPVRLLCSTRKPGHCRTPNAESPYPFYGLAILWSVFAIGTAWVLWRPSRRRR